MANAARTQEQIAQQVEVPEKDSPLLDLSDAAVKKFIKTAKARGYVTYDELNAVLTLEEVSSEQIEDTMSMLSDKKPLRRADGPGETRFPPRDLLPVESPHRESAWTEPAAPAVHHLRAATGIHNFDCLSYPMFGQIMPSEH